MPQFINRLMNLINNRNIKLSITLSFPTIQNCAIKSKCRYKFINKCFIIWNNGNYNEDCTCVIHEIQAESLNKRVKERIKDYAN